MTAPKQINREIIDALSKDALVILKTDTIYGIVGRASSPYANSKLYEVKGRESSKGFIVLVSSVADIPGLSNEQKQIYADLHNERPTTLVTAVPDSYLPHLTRHEDTLAFRVVNVPALKELIEKVGPLLAPSANPQGLPPAKNIDEAKIYFRDQVKYFVDSGEVEQNRPSRIIRVIRGELVTIRD